MNLSRSRLAWAVPGATVAGVIAVALAVGGVLPTTASADPHPDLPARTPAQLLAAVETGTTTALSGTVVETAALGLPDLPGSGQSAALTYQNLVLGTHTAKVWIDGPDKQRLALLGQLAESDVVHSGSDVWTYSSDSDKVGHTTLPAGQAHTPAPEATAMTPQALAERALAAIDSTTAVSVDQTQVVAGRPTYTLVLSPRDTASTVREVLISVDSATSVPLRVQVFGTTNAPALEVGFTEVSFATPAASVFEFSPPKGSTVGPIDLMGGGRDEGSDEAALSDEPGAAPTTASAKPVVHGTGWTSVVEIAAGQQALTALGSTAEKLTTTLPDGSHLLTTTLVNALLTPDGRLLVGAVTPARLQQTAAGK